MLLNSLHAEERLDEETKILVRGYGQMTLDQARSSAISRIEKALSAIKSNPQELQQWKNAESTLYGDSVVKALISAIISNSE